MTIILESIPGLLEAGWLNLLDYLAGHVIYACCLHFSLLVGCLP